TPTTTHTYITAGSYTATLTVTDTTGTTSPAASQTFTVSQTSPVVTGISPAAGPVGTVVTITGTGFVVGSTTAAVGGTPGTSVSCSTTTTCTVTSPSEAAGAVDVLVTDAGGTSTGVLADQF